LLTVDFERTQRKRLATDRRVSTTTTVGSADKRQRPTDPRIEFHSLTNAKPSAIFRLRGTFIPSAASSTAFGNTPTAAGGASSTATLGILCEPLESVEAQLAALGQSAAAVAANPATSTALVTTGGSSNSAPDPVRLAQLVGKNLFNAVAGFAQPLPGGQAGQWLPFEAIERWYRYVSRPPFRARWRQPLLTYKQFSGESFREFERKLRTTGVGFLLNSD
jgi:hypothetical protein